MKTTNKYRQAVFILVYKKEKKIKYLLLKRKLHWTGWEFPKGGIEKNETPLLASLRELKEETSLSPIIIESHNLEGKYDYDKKYPERKGFTGQQWKLFSCQVKNRKIKLDKKEHSCYKWLNFKEAEKILTWKNQKDCLKIINKSLEK